MKPNNFWGIVFVILFLVLVLVWIQVLVCKENSKIVSAMSLLDSWFSITNHVFVVDPLFDCGTNGVPLE